MDSSSPVSLASSGDESDVPGDRSRFSTSPLPKAMGDDILLPLLSKEAFHKLSIDRLLAFLIKTEVHYVNILKNYLNRVIKQIEVYDQISEPLIPLKEALVLISNIPSMNTFHRTLLTDLLNPYFSSERNLHLKIGSVFSNLAEYFKLYSEHIFGFRAALARTQAMSSAVPAFAEFLEILKHYSGQSLDSLITAPVHRLPEYLILLMQVYLKTPDDADEELASCREHLKSVLLIIRDIVLEIARKFRDSSKKENVVLIQKLFPNSKIVTPSRYVIKSGDVGFINPGKPSRYKKRFLVLFNDFLILGRRQKQFKKSKISRESGLSGMSAREIAEGTFEGVKYAVRIVSSTFGSFIAVVDSAESMRDWIDSINAAVANYEIEKEARLKSLLTRPIAEDQEVETDPTDLLRGSSSSISSHSHSSISIGTSTREGSVSISSSGKAQAAYKAFRSGRTDSFLPGSSTTDIPETTAALEESINSAVLKYKEFVERDLMVTLQLQLQTQSDPVEGDDGDDKDD